MIKKRTSIACAAVLSGAMLAQTAFAGSHTWRVNEVFSTSDGSIQFIELKESAGTPGETFIGGLRVTSVDTGNFFTFPAHLVGPTSNRHLLLATQSFADLPGAPTPNYIIPQNFFDQTGDTITYNKGTYDSWTFPAVPTDCVTSWNRNLGGTPGPAPNTPTNYAGATGSVDACPSVVGDLTGDGIVNGLDLGNLLANWSIPAGSPGCGGATPCAADINDDGVVDGLDLGILLANWTL